MLKQESNGFEGGDEANNMKIRITLTSCNLKNLEKGFFFPLFHS